MMQRLRLSLHFPPSIAFPRRTFRATPSKEFSDHHQTHLQNADALTSRLKSRSVLRFRGPDTVKFLQGLLTNDVRKFGDSPSGETAALPTPNMAPVSVPPIYAALLTPQGRFLFDFFLYRAPRPDEKLDRTGSGPGSAPDQPFELFADVDSSVLDELLDTLRKYRLRSKVEIDNVGGDYFCWQRYGKNLGKKATAAEEPEAASVGWGAGADSTAMAASHGEELGWQWFKDPRLECLGFRGIFPSNETPPLVEADKETDEENYLIWRLEKGVAEGSTEIPKGEAMPLEYNLAGLNAISFDKGCYVGQELTARTHHQGVIRKRIVPLRFLNDRGEVEEQKVSPRSEVIEFASGKKAGSVTTALGCRGLGLLRLEDAFNRSGDLRIQGLEDVKIEAIRPDWWPHHWLLDDHQSSAAA